MFALPAAPRDRDSIRVLIVDDDEFYAESIACFLAYENRIKVVGYARDGQEAVTLAASAPPDVIVMDLEMPRMNGFEATSRITRELDTVSVVILSSSTAGEDMNRARDAGATAYVTKASAADELIRAVLGARRPPMRRRPARSVRGGAASWLRAHRFLAGGDGLPAATPP